MSEEMEEQKKIERIRKSVIGLNEEAEKARKKFLSDLKRKSYLQVEEVKHR